tara:strand:+ start:202 stop:417 length:216 start_codon:yes stop_codon:yes gene_type:complete
MDWLCDSVKAIEHKKTCKNPFNCDKCQWIDASSGAMEEYGEEIITVFEPEPVDNHPLYDNVLEKFGGKEIA